jgi:hypothetical protein
MNSEIVSGLREKESLLEAEIEVLTKSLDEFSPSVFTTLTVSPA